MVSRAVGVPRPSTAVDAFTAFYDERWSALSTLALVITRDPSTATDVAQEAMTRVFARWGLLRDPFPWALRVTRNLAVDALRTRAREVSTAAVPDAAVEQLWPDPHLVDVVLALPERLRDVVLLHYLLDLPLTEVADITRRPVGTVKRRLYDARARLAELLGDLDD